MSCVFCERIAARDYDDVVAGVVSFEPLNPVTSGHRLFVPKRHVKNAFENPQVTAKTMEVAAVYARAVNMSCNLITSIGADATQTVMHLHIHYVPRRHDDGLHLPWTPWTW